jgi:DNA-nicking Smr family endonuclease
MISDDSKPRRRLRSLTAEERALWSQVTRPVAPLRRSLAAAPSEEPQAESPSPAPSPAPQAAPVPARRAPAPQLATSLDRRTKQRLARGHTEIEARLDLHGLTQAQAHERLIRFIHQARAQGARIVLVITGKGARDGDHETRGVLRRQVPLWLKSSALRDDVVGFSSAHFGHGGEGALYVRLRRARRNMAVE